MAEWLYVVFRFLKVWETGSDKRVKELSALLADKGRLLDGALGLLQDLGVEGIDQASRKLIFTDPKRQLRVLLLKPVDIPAYVIYGAAEAAAGRSAVLGETRGVDVQVLLGHHRADAVD